MSAAHKLTAAITAADIATAGTASVTVFNPAPGGGASNAVSFLVGTPKKVYLPLVVKSLPAPVLNAIDNADGDGNYTVSWNAVVGATSYTLEEDDNATFTSPTTQYNAAGTSWNAAGKAVGTYYYRVKASNSYRQQRLECDSVDHGQSFCRLDNHRQHRFRRNLAWPVGCSRQ